MQESIITDDKANLILQLRLIERILKECVHTTLAKVNVYSSIVSRKAGIARVGMTSTKGNMDQLRVTKLK